MKQASVFLFALLFAVPTVVFAAVPSGDDLYKAGDFTAAKTAYAAQLEASPNDAAAALGSARIAFYENRLDDAHTLATRALALDTSKNPAIPRLLSQIDARRSVLASAQTLVVPANGVRVPLLATDPLPLVELRVNGHVAHCIIDTGGPDLTLDPQFAKSVGLKPVDSGQTGQFAGNRSLQMQSASGANALIGGISIPNLTVDLIPSWGMGFFPGQRVDGIIGTVFLSRFRATLDYPHHQLILEPRNANPALATNAIIAPVWLVGDHFIITHGSVNSMENLTLMVDTGFAGGGFVPSESIIATAHVRTFPDKATNGVGGGGEVKLVPATADRLCVAAACQANVPGGYTPGGSPTDGFPFKISATASHIFFEQYALTFDFANMRLIMTPPNS